MMMASCRKKRSFAAKKSLLFIPKQKTHLHEMTCQGGVLGWVCYWREKEKEKLSQNIKNNRSVGVGQNEV